MFIVLLEFPDPVDPQALRGDQYKLNETRSFLPVMPVLGIAVRIAIASQPLDRSTPSNRPRAGLVVHRL